MVQFTSSTPLAALLGAAAISLAAPAAATRHHVAHHAASKHSTHHDKPPASAAPHGVTTVPAGGLKIYCARRSPLLVRKMTQGAGTTVTVICR